MDPRKHKAQEEFRPVTAPLINVTVVQINTIVDQHQQRYTAEADIRPSVEEIRARLPESTEEGAATSISVDVME